MALREKVEPSYIQKFVEKVVTEKAMRTLEENGIEKILDILKGSGRLISLKTELAEIQLKRERIALQREEEALKREKRSV